MSASLRYLIRQGVFFLNPPRDLDAKQKVLTAYRYISWFITSLFYMMGPPRNSYMYKLVVVIALFVFSTIILDYYISSKEISSIRFVAAIETLGLTLLLVPTGGLDSPFIWYALNPVLIALFYLRGVYCIINLAFYLIASVVISLELFSSEGMTVLELIREKSYIILVYILVTVAMRLLASLVKQLDQQAAELQRQKQALCSINEELHLANSLANRSLGHIMSLYHILETFSSREETHSILEQMVFSTAQILESRASFIWISPHQAKPMSILGQGLTSWQMDTLSNYLDKLTKEEEEKREKRSAIHLKDSSYRIVPIKSSARFYGYIGIEGVSVQFKTCQKENQWNNELKLLNFLGDLVAIILERHELEKLSSKLLILEEQNRIGNEIHDSVSQRLFSILCGVHTLHVSWDSLDEVTINQQLDLIEQSTKETSKELRSSIYQLSTTKNGVKPFKDNLESYLHDFASLNTIEVNFDYRVAEERISSSLKQALYRIIREAAGNAVRHGHCSKLDIRLWINEASLELTVADNGSGFNTALILQDEEGRGLGLKNMQVLTQTFSGLFELSSSEGVGTTLQIKFPLGCETEYSIKRRGGAA
ncbi:MAG: sensor histidine kinase [Desulfitobacterium sp.]